MTPDVPNVTPGAQSGTVDPATGERSTLAGAYRGDEPGTAVNAETGEETAPGDALPELPAVSDESDDSQPNGEPLGDSDGGTASGPSMTAPADDFTEQGEVNAAASGPGVTETVSMTGAATPAAEPTTEAGSDDDGSSDEGDGSSDDDGSTEA